MIACRKHACADGTPHPTRYLCKLSDLELRQSAARNMADLMWSTVKEPLDSTLCFDKESLDLAFKYFMSPTLTMRLAGLSQITVSWGGGTLTTRSSCCLGWTLYGCI